MVGIWENEDVDMENNHGAAKRKVVVGSADLSFKRDAMEIQPLF